MSNGAFLFTLLGLMAQGLLFFGAVWAYVAIRRKLGFGAPYWWDD